MITVLSLLAIAGFLACIGILVYCVARDRANRGMRVSHGKVYRERITKTIPGGWLERFNERTYGD